MKKIYIFALAFLLLIGLGTAQFVISNNINSNLNSEQNNALAERGYDESNYYIDYCEKLNLNSKTSKCIIVIEADGARLELYKTDDMSDIAWDSKVALKVNLHLQEKAAQLQRENEKVQENVTYSGKINVGSQVLIDS